MVCHAYTVSRHTPPILVRLSATPMLANKSYKKLVTTLCACAVAASAGSAVARVGVPSVVVSIMAAYAPRVQILPMPFHQFRTGQVIQLLLPSLERIYLFPAQPHLEMNLPQANSRLSMQVLLHFSPKIMLNHVTVGSLRSSRTFTDSANTCVQSRGSTEVSTSSYCIRLWKPAFLCDGTAHEGTLTECPKRTASYDHDFWVLGREISNLQECKGRSTA